MLPELIYREEKNQNFFALFGLAFVSAVLGFLIARAVFPTELDVIGVVFAAIPLIYPLNKYFYEDEKENAPHLPEIMIYGSLFAGMVSAFLLLGYLFPGSFELQSSIVGAVGQFTQLEGAFSSILVNNMIVFGAILLTAMIIGSSGAFILSWNASVMGYFFSQLIKDFESMAGLFSCSGSNPSPLCYLPHATFEIGGFIVAGVAGTLISAAVYRKHFDREVWKDYIKLVLAGVGMIVIGVILETA